MTSAPPTQPGPIPRLPPRRISNFVISLIIHLAAAVLTCLLTPLALGSNIWPIAAVFWSAFAIPVALGLGALLGLIFRRLHRPLAFTLSTISALVFAILAAFIISSFR